MNSIAKRQKRDGTSCEQWKRLVLSLLVIAALVNTCRQLVLLEPVTTFVVMGPNIHCSNNKYDNGSKPEAFAKLAQSGDGWEMWDRQRVLGSDGDHFCLWSFFRPFNGGNAPSSNVPGDIPMCLYSSSRDRYVSGSIKGQGRWSDCNVLPSLWKANAKTPSDLYVDIGGNIGSCMMEMLFSTQANIVVFEPDPRNLHKITSTLLGLPQSYRDRVALFPVALGVESATAFIHAASDNRGNAAVNVGIGDTPDQQLLPPVKIQVDTLDNVFVNAKDTNIALIKMDVQGFECNVVDGGKETFQRARVVKTEEEKIFLENQGCSGEGLRERFSKMGHTVSHREGLDITLTRSSRLGKLIS